MRVHACGHSNHLVDHHNTNTYAGEAINGEAFSLMDKDDIESLEIADNGGILVKLMEEAREYYTLARVNLLSVITCRAPTCV